MQKHTKHTLFRVFAGRDAGVRHCVRNLVKEHSSLWVIGLQFHLSYIARVFLSLAIVSTNPTHCRYNLNHDIFEPLNKFCSWCGFLRPNT